MAESANAPVREAMARLERRYEQDKITALGTQTSSPLVGNSAPQIRLSDSPRFVG